jgi:hypothetical protein
VTTARKTGSINCRSPGPAPGELTEKPDVAGASFKSPHWPTFHLVDHWCSLTAEALTSLGEKALFGAVPRVTWTAGEKKEFEEHASARLRTCISSALRGAAALLINILIIIPFLAGHRLHDHWNFARYLLFTAMALFLWFVLKPGSVWASWQSSRETRREFEDSGDAGRTK